MPSGWWHTVMNTAASIAITENVAPAAIIPEVLEELERRPSTWDGAPTATAVCAEALRPPPPSGSLLHQTAENASHVIAAASKAEVTLLVFQSCPTAHGARGVESVAAVVRRLAQRHVTLAVVIGCGADDAGARRALDMGRVDAGVRAVQLQGAMFKYQPDPALERAVLGAGPADDAHLAMLESWAERVIEGQAPPFLTPRDRETLARMMAREL